MKILKVFQKQLVTITQTITPKYSLISYSICVSLFVHHCSPLSVFYCLSNQSEGTINTCPDVKVPMPA